MIPRILTRHEVIVLHIRLERLAQHEYALLLIRMGVKIV